MKVGILRIAALAAAAISLSVVGTSRQTYAATKYWDTTAGAGNGVGGSGTWGTTFSTLSTGDASLTTAATSDDDIFQGTAGVITLSANQTANTLAFNTTGYIITGNNTSSTRTLTGPITLGSNVNLTIGNGETGNNTIGVGNISGSSGTLTINGAATGNNLTRLNLSTGTTPTISVPIITGTGFANIAGGAVGTQVTGVVTGNGSQLNIGATSGNVITFTQQISNGTAAVCIATGSSGGAGAVTLSGAGNNWGSTELNNAGSGVLRMGVVNALPTATTLLFGFSNGNGNSTVDLAGFNTTIGQLTNGTQSGGTISNTSGTAATLTISGSDTSAAAFSGSIQGEISLMRGGTGQTTLSGNNSYSGGTTVSGGVLKLGSSNALGTGGLTTTSGSVDLASNSPTLPNLNGAGGTITNSGSADSTLTINLAGGSSFGGALTDGALHKVALTVTGAGVFTLTGSSSNYSGGTVLNLGAIILANSAGSALGLGDLTLNGGTLASDPGSFSGSLIAGSSAHTVAPGGLGSIGTLVLGGSASLNGNSTLAFDIAGSAADQLQIGGTLSISSPVTLDVNTSGTLSGDYTLATYGNSPAVVAGDFNLGTELPVGYALDVTSTQLSLVAVPEPSTVALALAGAVLGLLGYARRRRARKSLDC